jgi:hypothetical protein
MPALVAGIHVLNSWGIKSWMAGTGPAMIAPPFGRSPSPAWRERKFNYSAARRGGGRIDSTPSTAVAEIVVRTM